MFKSTSLGEVEMETLEITENSAILRVADAREVSSRRNVIKLVGKGVNVRNMVTTITTALAGFPRILLAQSGSFRLLLNLSTGYQLSRMLLSRMLF